MDSIFLSKNLHFLRVYNKLTQAEIESRTGFKQRNWSNWENDVSQPSLSNLISISNTFGVPTDWILKLNLKENVYLMEKIPAEIADVECISKCISKCISNVLEEPEIPVLRGDGKGQDSPILEQLKTLTDEVKKIAATLQPKGI